MSFNNSLLLIWIESWGLWRHLKGSALNEMIKIFMENISINIFIIKSENNWHSWHMGIWAYGKRNVISIMSKWIHCVVHICKHENNAWRKNISNIFSSFFYWKIFIKMNRLLNLRKQIIILGKNIFNFFLFFGGGASAPRVDTFRLAFVQCSNCNDGFLCHPKQINILLIFFVLMARGTPETWNLILNVNKRFIIKNQ